MDAFMANSISDEDPETLAEATALIADEETRRQTIGNTSNNIIME